MWPSSACTCETCHLVAIAGSTILVPYHLCSSFEGRALIDVSVVVRYSNELHWLDLKTGHQESNTSNSHRCQLSRSQVNSLAPGRFQFNFRWVIFKLTLVNGGWGISYEIAARWMPLDLTDDKSILVQVMAWCRQTTSHYLNQSWPRSHPPYGVTRP